ncbi:MAG: HAMP domain-containing protein [Hormoscilla sp.]
MRSHPQRLVPALGKTIRFDYERAKFYSYVNHVSTQTARLKKLIDNNYSELLAAEETNLKKLVKKYENNTSAYVKLVKNLWEQIDPPNVRGEKISAAQQNVLVYMSGEIANKIDVKFDRLSEKLNWLISIAETQHAQARADQKKASELRLLIIVGSMLMSAAIATFLALYTSRAIASPLEQVTAVAQRVTTDANFLLRATVTTEDEVGSLAIALNQLIQWVGEHTYELERSRDRTASTITHSRTDPGIAIAQRNSKSTN